MDVHPLARMVAIAGAVALAAAACLRPGGPAPVTPAAPAATPAAAPVAAPPAVVPAPPAAAEPDQVDPAVCYSRHRVPKNPPGQEPRTGPIFGRDRALSPGAESALAEGPPVVPGPTFEGPPAEVHGDLDKEIIRRIIRRNIQQVKACYETSLEAHPGLGGEIVVEFLIPPSGLVSETHVARSTMGDPAVDDCVGRAMCGWQFPMPLDGRSVVITYPYKLTPAKPAP